MKVYALFATVVLAGLNLSPVYGQEENRMSQVVPPRIALTRAEDARTFNLNDDVSVREVITQSGLVRQLQFRQGGRTFHHNHPEEEMLVVISGRLLAVTADGEHILEAGDVIDLEHFAEHHFEAIEDTFAVQSFSYGRIVIKPDF